MRAEANIEKTARQATTRRQHTVTTGFEQVLVKKWARKKLSSSFQLLAVCLFLPKKEINRFSNNFWFKFDRHLMPIQFDQILIEKIRRGKDEQNRIMRVRHEKSCRHSSCCLSIPT